MLRCIKTSSLNGRLIGHPAIRSHSQSLSPFTKSFIFLKFPVFQSLKSASSITMPVLTLQHSSVLSVKRTRIKSKPPSSKVCSAQSTTFAWTPGYWLPGTIFPTGCFAGDLRSSTTATSRAETCEQVKRNRKNQSRHDRHRFHDGARFE